MSNRELTHGLLVDDDPVYLKQLQKSLARRGYAIEMATTSAEAMTLARAHPPDFILIDLRLGAESGLALIEPMRSLREDMCILLVTGYSSVATAVEAIKRGADNYLLKPVTVDAIQRALADERLAVAEPEPTMTPLGRLEWEHIQQALSQTQGNISAAARLLGMHRRSLQRKLAKRPSPERNSTEPIS